MKLIVIFHFQEKDWDFNLNELKNNPSDLFVLFTSKTAYCKHLHKHKDFFDKIIQFDVAGGADLPSTKVANKLFEIQFYTLGKLLQETITHFSITDKKSIWLLTVDESVMLLVSKLRDHFDLPGEGSRQLERFLNKKVMKDFIAKKSIRYTPYIMFSPANYISNPYQYLNYLKENLGELPYFAKPINSAASKGTRRIDSADELSLWCDTHLNYENYEIDKYIDGRLFSCNSIIQNDQVVDMQICESTPNYQFTANNIILTTLLPATVEHYDLLKDTGMQILDALKPLPNGLTHLEVLLENGSNKVFFLEIAARPPGGGIAEFYVDNFATSSQKIHYQCQLGVCENNFPMKRTNPNHLSYALVPYQHGKVINIHHPKLSSSLNIICNIQIGEIMQKQTHQFNKVAIEYKFEHSDYEVIKMDGDYLNKFKTYQIESQLPAISWHMNLKNICFKNNFIKKILQSLSLGKISLIKIILKNIVGYKIARKFFIIDSKNPSKNTALRYAKTQKKRG
ncbi:MAG: hypothetical protein HQK51_06340 [Oligoflexia bacterium]|nr:hypothetical protein [Oligoflexia bacterium]